MDFIALATQTDPRHVVRLLDQVLGDDAGSGSDSNHAYDGALSPGGAPASSSATEGAAAAVDNIINSQRPILSKTAEAELYLLATNFLLYVAMVIITVMVAKLYFPESLERGEPATSAPATRSYSYRMARSKEDGEEYYGSDVEDDDDEDDDEDEVLDSDEEDEGTDEGNDTGNLIPPSDAQRSSKFKRRSNFLEFQQSSLSKLQVVRRLVFCSLMLNVTFVLWGLLQERMLTRRYPRFTGEYFTYSYALVFTNRFWTLIMSGLLMLRLKPRRSQTTVIYEYSFPSISNMLSSWCQYEALRYVSFPATTLFKSFKLAPVMAMGKILGNKSYPQYDYVVALMIGVGCAMFMVRGWGVLSRALSKRNFWSSPASNSGALK